MDAKTKKKVLALHAEGLAVSQIAERLRLRTDETRSAISLQWAEEREAESLRARIAGRLG